MLTIVLPVKQSNIKKDCFFRLFCNLSKLRNLDKHINIVVADSSRGLITNIIKYIVKKHQVNYLHIDNKQKYYSPSLVKNISAKYVFDKYKSEYVFFLDVDVLIDNLALDYIYKLIHNRIKFFWFPVKFTRKTKSNYSMWKYRLEQGPINISKEDILQTGFVTGIQLIQKDLFFTLNGYNERFQGYGGEDIEFIHRATAFLAMRPKFMSDSCYFTDDRGYNISHLIGFRNFYHTLYFSFFSEIYVYHFWHKRKNKSAYLREKEYNYNKMIELMKLYDRDK